MLEKLRRQVLEANLALVEGGLVFRTWGNASGIDRRRGLVVIKPSGVPYRNMTARQMVVLSLDDGKVIEGDLRPSCDAPTHLVLYRAMPDVGGIVHTHSLCATAWAQARKPIPALGTTHADHFHGEIPCTRPLRPAEMSGEYETNTGKVILEALRKRNPADMPGILVAQHGPFAWGHTPGDAAENAAVLEQIALLAMQTLRVDPSASPVNQALLDRHYSRKHGPGAYYGQSPRNGRRE